MDMPTLLAWRATNRSNYVDACNELQSSLHRMLATFVPSPAALLSLLTHYHALLSGEFAICYLLRDTSLVPHSLDIYVGSVWFDVFIDTFGLSRELSGYQTSWITTSYADQIVDNRHLTHTLEISLSNGRFILIHASASPSACHAIACSPSSLGTTFITEYSFATAYPRLTFNRRAIVCYDLLGEGSTFEINAYQRLRDNGFSFEEDPTSWPDYSRDQYSDVDVRPLDCLRSLYICPQQGRYFGDEGSMVCFMDTLSADVSQLKEKCIPPYGIMAVWRLPSSIICDAECDEFNDILAPGVTATSIMFEDESFKATTRSGLMIIGCTNAGGRWDRRGRARSVTL